jgi:hypothetical protein
MKKVKGIDDALRLQIIQEHLSGASKCSLVRKYKLEIKLIYFRKRTACL